MWSTRALKKIVRENEKKLSEDSFFNNAFPNLFI